MLKIAFVANDVSIIIYASYQTALSLCGDMEAILHC